MTKAVKIIFTVSILLNLLLVGAFAGLALKHRSHQPWHEVKNEMAPETQHLMAKAYQDSRREMGVAIKDMRKGRDDLVKIMSAEEFDPEAYDVAMAKIVKARAEMGAKRMEATKEMAAQLPQSERKKLAQKFKRFGDRKHGGRRGDHKGKERTE